jgi:hypothetical protein
LTFPLGSDQCRPAAPNFCPVLPSSSSEHIEQSVSCALQSLALSKQEVRASNYGQPERPGNAFLFVIQYRVDTLENLELQTQFKDSLSETYADFG